MRTFYRCQVVLQINALNTSVNPCEDFYEFACGLWNEEHPIPDDMSAFGTFSFVREQVRQQLRGTELLCYSGLSVNSGLAPNTGGSTFL